MNKKEQNTANEDPKSNMRKTYYKAVCEEYPDGVIYERKEDALAFTKECRDDGEKAFVRAVKMTEDEFESLPEI